MVASSSSSSQLELDPKIWHHLPLELLERLLTFLPLNTLLPLRSTSKHLNSLILSPTFISQHSSTTTTTTPLSSFLLLSHPQLPHYFLYDTFLNTWRKSSLSLSPDLSRASLLSTSSCLLIFSLSSSSSSFLLHNLLSRSSRHIPFPEYPFAFGSLTFLSYPNGYKIFLLSSKSNSGPLNSAFVYDSTSHLWRQFQGFSRPLICDSFHQRGVPFHGLLYFITPKPFSVINFDLELGIWDRLPSRAELPENLTFVRLASDGEGEGNRLFLFGGIGENGISKSMKLWELKDEKEWVEIEKVPEMMSKKFGSVCYYNYEHIYCFWHQGTICVCCYIWPEILYYKVSTTRTWHWLPKCPSLPDKWSCGFKWFSFLPQLSPFV